MAGSAVIVLISAATLIWSIQRANTNLERAAAAQMRVEQLFQLSGRVSDYGIVALDAVLTRTVDGQKMQSVTAQVEQVFTVLDQLISKQVNTVSDNDTQSAIATKGLNLARMKAQFSSLNRQIETLLAQSNNSRPRRRELAQNLMNVFGLQFAPLLSQAIEVERQETQNTHAAMAELSRSIITLATSLILLSFLVSVLLYYFAGRPILKRIEETMDATEDVASGNFERRLKPRGRDELSLLMGQFNRMTDQIGRRENDLLKAQDALQATIDARTRDLTLSNEKLAQIDNQRRQFFSDISHELRTPLTVILGESDLALKNASRLDPELKTSFKAIKARSENLRRRVDDLLRVARSESGKLDLRLAAVDLNCVAVDAVEELKALAQKYKISFKIKRHATPLLVKGDHDWLRQAISGLLTNAIRYGASGKPITVKTGKDKSMVIISVIDCGAGIPVDERAHLFKRFYRGTRSKQQTEKRGDRGFGIGLSLIKWICEEHGGHLSFETNDGLKPTKKAPSHQGTCFTIKLPFVSHKTQKNNNAEDLAQ